MRLILSLHRCLSVLVGVLMTVWCLTGAVMLYVPYPRVTPAERLEGLSPLDLTHCCKLDDLGVADAETVRRFSLTMSAGMPVLRLTTAAGDQQFDLAEGRRLGPTDAQRAVAVAAEFARRHGVTGAAHAPDLIERDQWTVSMSGGPFWRVAFDGGAIVYVSQATGEVVQETRRLERALNWMGSIPHWLYPTALRQHEAVWRNTVAAAALLAAFLTVTGICVVVARLRRHADEGRAASRLEQWHHNLGLVFGLMALVWLGSGLSWAKLGALPSAAPHTIDGRALLAGKPVTWGQVRAQLAATPKLGLPVAAVEISAAPFGGRPFMSVRSPGQNLRYDARGEIFGPDLMQMSNVLSAKDGPGLISLIQLNREDGYYFGVRQPIRLPVWRAVLRDRDHTRLYIDQSSALLLRQVNASDRAYRWWHQGLHRLDFNTGLRRRPLWDVMVLLLLAGVTALSALGAWIGWRHIQADREDGQ